MTLAKKLSELVGVHVCVSCGNDAYSGRLIEAGEGYIVVDDERGPGIERVVILAAAIESITPKQTKAK